MYTLHTYLSTYGILIQPSCWPENVETFYKIDHDNQNNVSRPLISILAHKQPHRSDIEKVLPRSSLFLQIANSRCKHPCLAVCAPIQWWSLDQDGFDKQPRGTLHNLEHLCFVQGLRPACYRGEVKSYYDRGEVMTSTWCPSLPCRLQVDEIVTKAYWIVVWQSMARYSFNSQVNKRSLTITLRWRALRCNQQSMEPLWNWPIHHSRLVAFTCASLTPSISPWA